ncbi:MAG: hypothetical protein Q9N32_01105 [Gammaproteobacteria bacterium]|nr:hypothetical protein [Gammaproteobacteria bacterium]
MNFAKSNAGGIRAIVPSSSTWSPSKINDGASNIRWDGQNWLSRPGTMNNTFEFTFDPDLNGTPGEVSDQFTLESVSLYLPGTNRSLKNFEIAVETTAGWQPAIPLQAAMIAGKQSFPIGPFTNVLRVRLTTLNNYGGTYLQINEFEVNGNWNGHNPFFIASKTTGKQLFDLTAAPANNDGRLNNITRLRFNTISNYGITISR